jgi:hypothetical protein
MATELFRNPAPGAGFRGYSSAWIRTRDLTIMSRAQGANGGAARRTKHNKVLEIVDITNATIARS